MYDYSHNSLWSIFCDCDNDTMMDDERWTHWIHCHSIHNLFTIILTSQMAESEMKINRLTQIFPVFFFLLKLQTHFSWTRTQISFFRQISFSLSNQKLFHRNFSIKKRQNRVREQSSIKTVVQTLLYDDIYYFFIKYYLFFKLCWNMNLLCDLKILLLALSGWIFIAFTGADTLDLSLQHEPNENQLTARTSLFFSF